MNQQPALPKSRADLAMRNSRASRMIRRNELEGMNWPTSMFTQYLGKDSRFRIWGLGPIHAVPVPAWWVRGLSKEVNDGDNWGLLYGL